MTEELMFGNMRGVFSPSDVAWRDEMIRNMREALKFYADATNYLHPGWPHWSLVDGDNGKIARAALEEEKR